MRNIAIAMLGVGAILSSSRVLAENHFQLIWESGFEKGFPGEWNRHDNGSWSADGSERSGRTETWAIVKPDPKVGAIEGEHVYRGWLHGTSPQGSHRAYPVIHKEVETPLVNTFWVWLDVDYARLGRRDWIHFGTWGNNPDWRVHTMSVRDRKLEMAHLDWNYIGPEPQPEFPLRRWVRLTAYIHYRGSEGYIRVWQDGVAILEGTRSGYPGKTMMRAHWGMYAGQSADHGVQLNDAIQVWTLSTPLTDLETEPLPKDYPYNAPFKSVAGSGS